MQGKHIFHDFYYVLQVFFLLSFYSFVLFFSPNCACFYHLQRHFKLYNYILAKKDKQSEKFWINRIVSKADMTVSARVIIGHITSYNTLVVCALANEND